MLVRRVPWLPRAGLRPRPARITPPMLCLTRRTTELIDHAVGSALAGRAGAAHALCAHVLT